MNFGIKRVALSSLVTFAAVASLTVATTPQAFAINPADCSRSDFLKIDLHDSTDTGQAVNYRTLCFANAGEVEITPAGYWDVWITRISTGNNRVQWHGDGKWQPSGGIDKNTVFTWPNNPGGVDIDRIRIL
ncbi:beta/gamma crystallin [Streptomyces sp. Ag109_O5-1]|uniref:beta/gamma crystallin domain-containing protein n=1 Tax=Streptomyces sp. Ag109_O5-1 TaxID=1938851 RepID=UPI000F50876B|nr:beta/gamma crystallin domain-containing protein [Streptomyces sp. Ag109_O5-1]RPE39147.1 beta/gamma crystallin [Streptomyces sp. Ag109_O5-1]